jgi:hypothetical protein
MAMGDRFELWAARRALRRARRARGLPVDDLAQGHIESVFEAVDDAGERKRRVADRRDQVERLRAEVDRLREPVPVADWVGAAESPAPLPDVVRDFELVPEPVPEPMARSHITAASGTVLDAPYPAFCVSKTTSTYVMR